jgi:hypothetical protein
LTTIGIDPKLIVEEIEVNERESTPPRPELTEKELKKAQKSSAALDQTNTSKTSDEKMEIDQENEASANTNSEISHILGKDRLLFLRLESFKC